MQLNLGLPLLDIIGACWQTLYIVFLSTFASVLLGLLLGLLLFFTVRRGLMSQPFIHHSFGLATNIVRSIPFIVLLFALIPFTRWLIGTSIGNNAALVPLVIGAIPFYARLAEAAFNEVPKSMLEMANAIGANKWQIIVKILIPEALPSLIKGATLTAIALVGYSAMTGIVGGGGLGELAYDYGYEQGMLNITLTTIILLVIFVQCIQWLGDWLVKKRTLKPAFWLSCVLLILCIGSQVWPTDLNSKNTLVVGVMSGPEEHIMQVAQEVAAKDQHFKLKLVVFSDYNTPNAALNSGAIDANIFQHKPFLDRQIRKYGYHIHAIAKTFVYPFGFYSRKIQNIKELTPHTLVALPNDPSNEGRALRLLQKAHLITLKPGVGLFGTIYDVASNPLQLKLLTMASAQIPHALDDVTLAGLTNDYVKTAGFTVQQALLKEGKDSPYANLIVVRSGDHNPLFPKLIAVMHSQEVVQATFKQYPNGAAVKAW